MRKLLIIGLIFATLLLNREAVARCPSFDLVKASKDIPILVRGKVIQSKDVKMPDGCPDNDPTSECLYRFTVDVVEILKGEVNSDSLHFSYAFWTGCPGVDTFQEGEERIFAVSWIGPNGQSELFGKSCGMTGISTKRINVVNSLREALATGDTSSLSHNPPRGVD
jgi:hypothetical protein